MKPIVFTGGGTGGHVYPALAVAARLPDDARRAVVWIGSRRGIERTLVRAAAIPYHAIPTGKLRRYLSLENALDVGRVVWGCFAAFVLLRRLRPAVVFSKGGFVAVPVVTAARLLGLPVLIHESDADPGLATRLSAPMAEEIYVPYSATRAAVARRYRRRCRVTGNPVRREFFQRSDESVAHELGLPDDGTPLLVVTGGSLGADQLNRIILALLPDLTSRARIVHQVGRHGREVLATLRASASPARYVAREHFGAEFPRLLAAADLVLARAGAGTIWELAATSTPAVLVPLSTGASRGDQIRNAEYYRAAGAAVVVPSAEASPLSIGTVLRELLADSERRKTMSAAAHAFGAGDAAATIADRVDWWYRRGSLSDTLTSRSL